MNDLSASRRMGSVTTFQARDFYRAAANFYRQAPWRNVGDGETIKVACEQLESSPWFALVLGKRGQLKGLMLCDDWESRLLMAHAEYQLIADRLQNITLHYGAASAINSQEREVAKRQRFEVAGPKAYPSVFRTERGRSFRAPGAWELELLEACLWVIPDFLKRAEDRSPAIFEYAFRGTIGKMSLELSWISTRPTDADWLNPSP